MDDLPEDSGDDEAALEAFLEDADVEDVAAILTTPEGPDLTLGSQN